MNEAEFWSALSPTEIKPVEYRLYYGERGEPLFFSQEDLPGNYINVSKEVYVNSPAHIQVVDGVLVILNNVSISKIIPSRQGIPCHPQDVSIVVDEKSPYIKWNIV
jgi:hypothetical protein